MANNYHNSKNTSSLMKKKCEGPDVQHSIKWILAGAVFLLFDGMRDVFAQPQPLPSNYPSDIKINYVRTWEATAPESNPNILTSRPLKDVKQGTQYFDGLGRPLQTVIKQGSSESGARCGHRSGAGCEK